MLGKLFRYEFKSTCKVILIVYAVLTGMTALGMFALSRPNALDTENPANVLFIVVYFFLYVLSIAGAYFIILIYLTVHFYKTMYSAQGYLTHTLPVKPLTTYHVKLLVSAVWTLLSTILVALSLAGLFWAMISPYYSWNYLSFTFNEAKAIMLSSIGMSTAEFVTYIVVAFLLSSFLAPLRVYLSCSIGQLFHTHKLAASIVAGIIIIFTHNMIGSLFSNGISVYQESANLFNGDTVWILLGFDAIFMILFYVATNFIVRKHINLE